MDRTDELRVLVDRQRTQLLVLHEHSRQARRETEAVRKRLHAAALALLGQFLEPADPIGVAPDAAALED